MGHKRIEIIAISKKRRMLTGDGIVVATQKYLCNYRMNIINDAMISLG